MDPELDGLSAPTIHCDGQPLWLSQHRYATGHLRLHLDTAAGEVDSHLTYNVPELTLPEGCVAIRLWEAGDRLLPLLCAAGVLADTGERIDIGDDQAAIARVLVPVTVPEVPDPKTTGQLRADYDAQVADWLPPGMQVETIELDRPAPRRRPRRRGQR